MDVPFVDLGRDNEVVAPELGAAFERVLGRGDFVLGQEAEEFEREFALYVGTEHCIGVASGTAALTLAIRSLGIGAGDEVIVPTHTFIASAFGVLHAGATPVFCDVDEGRGLIDLDSASAVLSERTAAVLPVHLYGQACDMDAIVEWARDHDLAVVEDAAQAHGARWRDASAGSFGAASAFSFYPSKNLGALGDGGAICTNDPEVAERARRLRNLGQRRKGEHLEAGWNERLDTLQAAFLRAKLPQVDRWNERRRNAAAKYAAELPDGVRTLLPAPDATDTFHLYPIRAPRRDDLAAELGRAGIATGIHYSPPVHAQPPFSVADAREFPVAERWAREELSLPIFPSIQPEQIAHVCHVIGEWLSPPT